MEKYQNLINQLCGNNRKQSSEASNTLIELSKNDNSIVPLLINEMNSSKATAYTNNAIALVFREIKDERAFPAILNAIRYPKDSNNISTLVYALENYNCEKIFIIIFYLFVTSGKADVMWSAYHILKNQAFYIKKKDIVKAQKILDDSNLSDDDRVTAQDVIEYFSN